MHKKARKHSSSVKLTWPGEEAWKNIPTVIVFESIKLSALYNIDLEENERKTSEMAHFYHTRRVCNII